MEISEKLSKWKFHFLFGVAVSVLVISSPIYLSPRLVEVVAFFGPLFLSTALFLVAVLVFGRNLPVAEPHGEKAAEVILDLVTGQPVVIPQPTEEQDEQEVIKHNQTQEQEEEEEELITNKPTEEEEEQGVIKNNQTEEEEELIRSERKEEEVQAARAESVESERKM